MDKKEFQIDFIGIGFPKSGTSWVSQCLEEHPEIDFAKSKETNFFTTKYCGFPKEHYYYGRPKNIDAYMKEFNFTEKFKVRGEFSVLYAADEGALRKIKKFNPDVKIIVCLRSPKEVINSTFWFFKSSYRNYELPPKLTVKAFEENDFLQALLRMCYYSRHLSKWFKTFDEENIHVILMRDIRENSKRVVLDLCNFLNVRSEFDPECLEDYVNETQRLRFPVLSGCVAATLKFFRNLSFANTFYKFMSRNLWITSTYNFLFKRKFSYPKLPSSVEEFLKDKYKREIESLEILINRDLSDWV